MQDRFTYKEDRGKEPYSLIPEICVREIFRKNARYSWAECIKSHVEIVYDSDYYKFLKDLLDVLKYGIKKYGKKDSWMFIQDAQDRYSAAFIRHQMSEEAKDKYSGLSHSAHAMCNAMFLLYFEIQESLGCDFKKVSEPYHYYWSYKES